MNSQSLTSGFLFPNFVEEGVLALAMGSGDEQMLNPSSGFVVYAPDKGAAPFVTEVFNRMCEVTKEYLIQPQPQLLLMDKHRSGERKVTICAAESSPTSLDAIKGREIVVIDDMVRTGNTMVECCRQLKEAGATRIIFVVTHFYSSAEVKENLNDASVDARRGSLGAP